MANDRLAQVLRGEEDNYLLPFFWLHGESREVLEEYIEKIYASGCRAFCVESRPHPDFLEEGWWRDMDIILEKAESMAMKVWILDDAHFPTGYANGRITTAPDALKQWYIRHKEMDFAGPVKNGRISITSAGKKSGMMDPNEEIVSAVLVRRTNEGDFDTDGTFEDLTEQIKDGWLTLNLPEGYFRLYVTARSVSDQKVFADYIDMTNPESVHLLLEETYEKHYAHYKERFGNTICGFFSDEPGFYNSEDPSGYSFDYQIGSEMKLPWNAYIAAAFSEKLTEAGILEKDTAQSRVKSLLPALWFPCGVHTEAIRACYMDAITDLYRKNFTGQISKWCEEHGVEYIGHVIEDNNCHCRLGCGPGHYFRSLDGQHMAGVDVVLQQILPGKDRMQFGMSSRGPQDGAFSYYGLAKLGASMAHMDPATKGRAMCEIFGAYGWEEGITMMKWLADHMMVRGQNVFVPHAFTDKQFPDPDCPPHFYARGYNPQYRYMGKVFNYMNRICHLLSGGRPVIRTGILYHGEMEWLGRSAYFQNIGRELYRAQIDYDVIDLEHLCEAVIEDGKIKIGLLEIESLLIPYADRYPKAVRECVKKCRKKGIKVIQVIDELPNGSRHGNNWYFPWNQEGELLEDCDQVKLSDLTAQMHAELEVTDIKGDLHWLRVYHYRMEDGRHAYMLFNESMAGAVSGRVKLPEGEDFALYDGVENALYDVCYDPEKGMELKLYPGESAVFVSGGAAFEKKSLQDSVFAEKSLKNGAAVTCWKAFDGKIRILAAEYTDMDAFDEMASVNAAELENFSMREFAGILHYEFTVTAENGLKLLDLGECKDAAQVWVNGKEAGIRIGYPYIFDISGQSICGENHVRIEVATTLIGMECDYFSKHTVLEPEGLRGPVMYQEYQV